MSQTKRKKQPKNEFYLLKWGETERVKNDSRKVQAKRKYWGDVKDALPLGGGWERERASYCQKVRRHDPFVLLAG
jgi:hypothetical protein